jgi:putative oxidoreductase
MERWLGRSSEIGYCLLRFVAGMLFACHGAQKLFGALGGQKVEGDPLMMLAGIIEFGGGVLICIGLWSGYAAFLSSGQMAAAYFYSHAPNGFWPIRNKGELAVLYCFVFLFIAMRGSGRYSVEGLALKQR